MDHLMDQNADAIQSESHVKEQKNVRKRSKFFMLS